MNLDTEIRACLAALEPTFVELIDDSAKHAGHAGAKGGGKHYQLVIVAPCFTDLPKLARHRMVYDALGSLMRKEIHALSINARSPREPAQGFHSP